MRWFTPTLMLLAVALPALSAPEPPVDTRLTDAQFFEALNLEYPGLERVRAAVRAGDLKQAKHALAAYYRQRTGVPWTFNPHQIDRNVEGGERAVAGVADMVAGKGFFGRRMPNGDLQWIDNPEPARFPTRVYWFDALGKAYWATGDERYTRAWLWQLRSWIRQCPAPDEGVVSAPQWNTMDAGIRLRGSWPAAFHYFLHSPEFTDDDLVLYLKSTVEQSRFIRAGRFRSTNWITFAMAGLYTSGALFPELKEAADWRRHAADTARAEMTRLYLPDGVANELSPSYHQFFTNFWTLAEVAERVGRGEEIAADLDRLCEEPCVFYVKCLTPDRNVPRFNDSGAVDVPAFLARALERYPNRADFRWVATDGKEGTPPSYTSHLFDYAGYAILRSGWERDANYLAFDAGPPGNSHVHQDKLNVILWAYGRELLYDIGISQYDTSKWRAYSVDTHSHNTVMVDGRPQRRRWGTPGPGQMPYQPVNDLRWKSEPGFDFVAGVYDEAYGAVGFSEWYPYTNREAFLAGWVLPATHHRRVLFLKPDLFVIADTLTSKDGAAHTYEARWHLKTTATAHNQPTGAVVTTDAGKPNLAVVPLLREDLETRVVTGQETPELLGWNAQGNNNNTPTATVLHTRRGEGRQQFLTLLLPLRAGQENPVRDVRATGPTAVEVTFADGRRLQIEADADPNGGLQATERLADGKPGRRAAFAPPPGENRK